MGQPLQNHAINYIEFVSSDLEKTKKFYATVFGWIFQDWGPEYISFEKVAAGIDGGFRKADAARGEGAPLIVLYSHDLKTTEQAIVAAGGKIVVPTFDFPGGRRFHFDDGVGNVLAVWSE